MAIIVFKFFERWYVLMCAEVSYAKIEEKGPSLDPFF